MLKKLWRVFMWALMAFVVVALWNAPVGFEEHANGAVITFFCIAMYYRARYNRLRDCMDILAEMKANDILHKR